MTAAELIGSTGLRPWLTGSTNPDPASAAQTRARTAAAEHAEEGHGVGAGGGLANKELTVYYRTQARRLRTRKRRWRRRWLVRALSGSTGAKVAGAPLCAVCGARAYPRARDLRALHHCRAVHARCRPAPAPQQQSYQTGGCCAAAIISMDAVAWQRAALPRCFVPSPPPTFQREQKWRRRRWRRRR